MIVIVKQIHGLYLKLKRLREKNTENKELLFSKYNQHSKRLSTRQKHVVTKLETIPFNTK